MMNPTDLSNPANPLSPMNPLNPMHPINLYDSPIEGEYVVHRPIARDGAGVDIGIAAWAVLLVVLAAIGVTTVLNSKPWR